MDVKVGDVVLLKKQHPCGNDKFTVTRVGMDFKFKCHGCGNELMIARVKAEKAIKKILISGEKDV
jgi:hypothetical protein